MDYYKKGDIAEFRGRKVKVVRGQDTWEGVTRAKITWLSDDDASESELADPKNRAGYVWSEDVKNLTKPTTITPYGNGAKFNLFSQGPLELVARKNLVFRKILLSNESLTNPEFTIVKGSNVPSSELMVDVKKGEHVEFLGTFYSTYVGHVVGKDEYFVCPDELIYAKRNPRRTKMPGDNVPVYTNEWEDVDGNR